MKICANNWIVSLSSTTGNLDKSGFIYSDGSFAHHGVYFGDFTFKLQENKVGNIAYYVAYFKYEKNLPVLLITRILAHPVRKFPDILSTMRRAHHRRKSTSSEEDTDTKAIQLIETRAMDTDNVKQSRISILKSSTTNKKASSISVDEFRYFLDRSNLLEDDQLSSEELQDVITKLYHEDTVALSEYPSENEIELIKQKRLQKRLIMEQKNTSYMNDNSVTESPEEMEEILKWEEETMRRGQYFINKTTAPKDNYDQLPIEYDYVVMILPIDQAVKQLDVLNQINLTLETEENSLKELEKRLGQLFEHQKLCNTKLESLNEKEKFYKKLQQHLIDCQIFNEKMLPKLDILRNNPENIQLLEDLLSHDHGTSTSFLDLESVLKPLIAWKQIYPDEFEISRVISLLPSLLIFHIKFEGLYHNDVFSNPADSYSWYQAIRVFKSDNILWETCIQEALFIMSSEH